jgi:EAL domain-containing protein (putative c-di-GMP-specific phosphodiesterase class I)
MPVHVLKVDGSFVRDLAASADDRAIVSTIVALGHALGMDVLAECVETHQQFDLLREMGCDAIQGYLYSAPLPADETFLALRDNRLPSLS